MAYFHCNIVELIYRLQKKCCNKYAINNVGLFTNYPSIYIGREVIEPPVFLTHSCTSLQ